MRPLYTSERMLDASSKAPLSATFRHMFDDRLRSSQSLQVQWVLTNGQRARRFSTMAHASGAPTKNRHDKSMALFTMFLRPLFGCTRREIRDSLGARSSVVVGAPPRLRRQLRDMGGRNPFVGRKEEG
jgi:hypothetical protein